MGLIKQLVRHQVLPRVMAIGGDRMIRSMSRHRILNVMYHGVVRRDANWFTPRHMTIENFGNQLDYLRRNFEVLTLSQAFELRKAGVRPDRAAVTVSFDDGYVNNLTEALPIIEKYEVPVTFFVVGTCATEAGQRVLWPDVLACLGRKLKGRTISIAGDTYRDLREVRTGVPLLDRLKHAQPAQRDDLLGTIMQEYDIASELGRIDEEAWRLMDPGQLERFAASPFVEIGSHGYGHYNLGMIPLEDAISDMSRSKAALESLINRPVRCIAYPDGSYSAGVKDAAERLGFERQLAVDLLLDNDPSDLRILPRHGMPSTTTNASALFFMNKAFKRKGFC